MRGTASTLALAVTLVLGGCGIDYEDLAERRDAYGAENRGDVVVAAILEPGAETYLNGIRLAAKELNESPEKVLGHRVEILVKSGGEEVDAVQDSVLDIARNPRVSAVLGHRSAEIAISASVIYEASQIIFMPPFATAKALTSYDFKFTFRMVPNSVAMAEQLASVAELLGHKDIALLYDQDDFDREQAFLFEDAAIARGMSFVHRSSVSGHETDYRELIMQFANKPVDLVFLSTEPAAGARIVRQLREMGVKVPVMGSDRLNARSFAETVGTAGDNTIVPMVYHAGSATLANQRFRAAYRELFGGEADQDAAQGYDSLRLLAAAMEKANTTQPRLVGSSLHYLPYWAGVTGVHAFDTRGEVSGKKYFFQVLRNGRWVFLPAVHMPFFLERFDLWAKAQPNRRHEAPSFAKSFATNLAAEDLRMVQLDFLHEILQFRRLGIIYGAAAPDQIPENLARILALGQKHGFETRSCGVVFSGANPGQVERQLVDCYGKLSIEVDALNIIGFPATYKDTVLRLQKPLREYKIPVLALQGDTGFDEGTAIRIGRFEDRFNIQTDFYLELFSGILTGIKTYELAERLNNLPVMAVNLKLLNEYGLLHTGSLVGLAPDLYLEWLVSAQ